MGNINTISLNMIHPTNLVKFINPISPVGREDCLICMEKLYDDMVIGGMYSSRSAEERGILKIDGRTKYKNANW